MGSKFLEVLPEVASKLVCLFEDGVVLYATDTQRFVLIERHKFDIPFAELGKEFSRDGSVARAIVTKQQINQELDESLYGVPLKSICFPVFDDDNPRLVIGACGIALPRDTASTLRKMSDHFEQGLNEVSAAIQQTAAAAGDINLSEKRLNEEILEISRVSGEIAKVLDFIKGVADETKMLGLNAAIEAARAGEVGRGFGVVAEEIRKLSEVSKNTTTQIKDLTKVIEQKIKAATKASEVALKASEEQAAATEEITANVQEMTAMAEELNRVAQKL